MRFIVTGGCGFVGSAVVRALVDRGERVLNIDRRRRSLTVPILAPLAGREGYARLEADVTDRTLMRAIMREFQPERVIHLASAIEDDSEALFDSEVAGAFSVLEAARHHLARIDEPARAAFRFVHALDASADNEFAEETLAPSPRQAARATAARLISGWSQSHSLPLVTCAADHVFGPWQRESDFLPGLIASLLAGQSFALAAAGETVRDWLPIRDFTSGLIAAADAGAPFARYDFSVGAERRDLDIAEAVCAMLDGRLPPRRPGWTSLIRIDGDPADATTSPTLDPGEAERELDWRPQGFHAGLERAISWAVDRLAPKQAAVAAE